MNDTTPAQGTPLLPCPFCGSEAESHGGYSGHLTPVTIQCESCFAEVSSLDGLADAIAKWNQRASNPERQRLIAELAESQAYALQLERALGEAWTPVPHNLTIVFPDTGYPWVYETKEEVRLCRRTSSSPTAGEGE